MVMQQHKRKLRLFHGALEVPLSFQGDSGRLSTCRWETCRAVTCDAATDGKAALVLEQQESSPHEEIRVVEMACPTDGHLSLRIQEAQDKITVYGRDSGSAEWTSCPLPVPLEEFFLCRFKEYIQLCRSELPDHRQTLPDSTFNRIETFRYEGNRFDAWRCRSLAKHLRMLINGPPPAESERTEEEEVWATPDGKEGPLFLWPEKGAPLTQGTAKDLYLPSAEGNRKKLGIGDPVEGRLSESVLRCVRGVAGEMIEILSGLHASLESFPAECNQAYALFGETAWVMADCESERLTVSSVSRLVDVVTGLHTVLELWLSLVSSESTVTMTISVRQEERLVEDLRSSLDWSATSVAVSEAEPHSLIGKGRIQTLYAKKMESSEQRRPEAEKKLARSALQQTAVASHAHPGVWAIPCDLFESETSQTGEFPYVPLVPDTTGNAVAAYTEEHTTEARDEKTVQANEDFVVSLVLGSWSSITLHPHEQFRAKITDLHWKLDLPEPKTPSEESVFFCVYVRIKVKHHRRYAKSTKRFFYKFGLILDATCGARSNAGCPSKYVLCDSVPPYFLRVDSEHSDRNNKTYALELVYEKRKNLHFRTTVELRPKGSDSPDTVSFCATLLRDHTTRMDSSPQKIELLRRHCFLVKSGKRRKQMFLSYHRAYRAPAEAVKRILEGQGYEVLHDGNLPASQEYRDEIDHWIASCDEFCLVIHRETVFTWENRPEIVREIEEGLRVMKRRDLRPCDFFNIMGFHPPGTDVEDLNTKTREVLPQQLRGLNIEWVEWEGDVKPST